MAFAGGLLFFGEKNGWRKLPRRARRAQGIVPTIRLIRAATVAARQN
ncbi:MAG: hypothetical protein U1F87_09400 [Kiritimatiellia bacterium]